jgi:hypothetical protein
VEGPLVRTADAGDTGGAPSAVWSPSPGISWQAQLSGDVDPTLDVALFYLDPDNIDEATRSELEAADKRLACYVSAGSLEPWRDDAGAFPESVLGNPLAGYPDERWLDIRDAAVRELVAARIERLAGEGCDAVLPANLDGYLTDSGFELGATDALDYASFLAAVIHEHGMSAGLSLGQGLVAEAIPNFDWALAIDCLSSSGCADYQPVRAAGKTVLLVEFGDESDVPEVCPTAQALGFDALIKEPDFGEFRVPCPG